MSITKRTHVCEEEDEILKLNISLFYNGIWHNLTYGILWMSIVVAMYGHLPFLETGTRDKELKMLVP
jgi:hypothetical protein